MVAELGGLVDARRHELRRSLAEVQQAVLTHDTDSEAGLLLEGVALRLRADLRWLEACERTWSARSPYGKDGKGGGGRMRSRGGRRGRELSRPDEGEVWLGGQRIERDGGAVVELGFAQALGVRVGGSPMR